MLGLNVESVFNIESLITSHQVARCEGRNNVKRRVGSEVVLNLNVLTASGNNVADVLLVVHV
jgi:hypothetical protein